MAWCFEMGDITTGNTLSRAVFWSYIAVWRVSLVQRWFLFTPWIKRQEVIVMLQFRHIFHSITDTSSPILSICVHDNWSIIQLKPGTWIALVLPERLCRLDKLTICLSDAWLSVDRFFFFFFLQGNLSATLNCKGMVKGYWLFFL